MKIVERVFIPINAGQGVVSLFVLTKIDNENHSKIRCIEAVR